jgi:DNA-binding protein H-NS
MKIDLNALSRKELEKLQSDVEKALTRRSKQDMTEARKAAEKAAAAFGFDLSDIAAPAKGKPGRKPKAAGKSKKKAAVKFRNSANKDETWTGLGRKPKWLAAAEKAGKSVEDFRI